MASERTSPEIVLRQLAEQRLRELGRTPKEATARVYASARAYLMGAAEALEEIGVLESGRGFPLVDELLGSSTEELVARGDLARVAIRVEQTDPAEVRHDPRQSLLAALTQLH